VPENLELVNAQMRGKVKIQTFHVLLKQGSCNFKKKDINDFADATPVTIRRLYVVTKLTIRDENFSKLE